MKTSGPDAPLDYIFNTSKVLNAKVCHLAHIHSERQKAQLSILERVRQRDSFHIPPGGNSGENVGDTKETRF